MILALVLALQDPGLEARVRELAEKLTGDAIDAREEAAAALVDLGPAAVPFLERAAGDDPERRGRVDAIVREIAREAVLRATWRPARRMDAAWIERPVADALRTLAAALGEEIRGSEAVPGRVTLDLHRATLWEALDALCRAAPALTWAVEGEALVVKAAKRPPFPARASGELLAWIDSVEYGRDVDFSGVNREWGVVGVNLAWTSGLAPASIELRVNEVLDAGGRNLLGPGALRFTPPAKPRAEKARHRREEARVALVQGAKIDRVRGSGALVFPRAFEDARIPFGAAGAVKAGDARVALRGGTSTKGSCAFQAVITYEGAAGAPRLAPSEVAVIDDQGAEHLASGRGQGTSFSGTTWSIHQNYEAPLPPDRRATSVRFRILKDVVERRVDFDFQNLPGP